MNTRKKKHLYVLASWIFFLFGESSLTCFFQKYDITMLEAFRHAGKIFKSNC